MTTMLTITSSLTNKKFTPLLLLLTMALMDTLNNSNQTHLMINMLNHDNISNLLLALSLFSTLLVLSASQQKQSITQLTMMINMALVMAFMSSSLLNFYIMFELSIIPTFLLIMKTGNQPERLKASMYLLMYTIFASLPLLAMIASTQPTTTMTSMMIMTLILNNPLLFILAFLVKLPMYSLHLWLPKAHVEAPMEGSMVLAAILLKLGSYGLLRMLPLMKKFTKTFSPLMMSISLMGCMTTALICNRQKDLKAMVAYSSVAHMGLIIISLFSLSNMATLATLSMTITHGMVSSALFFIVTISYSPFHSRNTHIFKGLMNNSPNMSLWWFLLLAANIGTPPFMSLMSEIIAINNAMYWSISTLIPITTSGMLITSFSIFMYSQINHNNPSPLKKMMMKPATSLSLAIHTTPLIAMIINPMPLLLPNSLTPKQ